MSDEQPWPRGAGARLALVDVDHGDLRFSTATPVANWVEAYVTQRYLRPDLLEAAVFDTWAATFGQVVNQIDLAPEGGNNFRLKSQFVGSPTSPRCCGYCTRR